MAKTRQKSRLTLLGKSRARPPTSPNEATLETFENPSRRPYWVRFDVGDFTSLCPVTGQADFARITIDYMPGGRCIESKSLKFYLASFRGERAFNERIANRILDDLVRASDPQKMVIKAEFAARGGISLTITAGYPDEAGSDA